MYKRRIKYWDFQIQEYKLLIVLYCDSNIILFSIASVCIVIFFQFCDSTSCWCYLSLSINFKSVLIIPLLFSPVFFSLFLFLYIYSYGNFNYCNSIVSLKRDSDNFSIIVIFYCYCS